MNIWKRIQIKYARSPKKRAELIKLYQGGVSLGERCEIYPDVSFGSEPYLVQIGNHVRITSGVKFITHDGGVWVARSLLNKPEMDLFGRIIIEDNCMIGTEALIMPNVRIGRNSIVAARAVVTKSVPENSVVAGVPARVIESIDEYCDKAQKRAVNTKLLSKKEKEEYLKREYLQSE